MVSGAVELSQGVTALAPSFFLRLFPIWWMALRFRAAHSEGPRSTYADMRSGYPGSARTPNVCLRRLS
jgi:hypothetical protein